MSNRKSSLKTEAVFSVLLFTAFAIAVLMTLMLGASFYQRMNEMSQSGHEERTSLSYIWSKIKNNDKIDMISVGDFEEIPALLLFQVYGDTKYVTRIYVYEGWIYELFSEYGLEMLPENGTPILEAPSLSFAQTGNGMIRVTAGLGSVLIYPRSGSEFVRGSFE
ncbi:MAG: DUF4860 domain-containing protein [Defluviitaleaceae bacterium]|nr:DUF4860 domain-containing protein [Defluviitaleaceae bacterium]